MSMISGHPSKTRAMLDQEAAEFQQKLKRLAANRYKDCLSSYDDILDAEYDEANRYHSCYEEEEEDDNGDWDDRHFDPYIAYQIYPNVGL